ncbi:flagellar export protein FliJ [Alteribacillus sp. YIM 98480]|uniref:flagellar export protein FliJ n=1 Tax=Alteribacillus sp. YIM 98480 TaxID=2606599 RepID=UPI00131BAB78|nr:flagellar export protein FliJ [Alteribacillus sp. YIM 98480]
MSFEYPFQKILELKEQEKEKKEQEYQQSFEQFESMASSLYELLKQKEQMESVYQDRMSTGILIQDLQLNEKLVIQLQQQIHQIKLKTDQARNDMYQKEKEMQNASIECKKYEKVKAWKKEAYEQHVKREEEKQMDEISTRRYVFQ